MKRFATYIVIFALLSSDYLIRAQVTPTGKPSSGSQGTSGLISQVLSGGLLGNVVKLGGLGEVLNLACKLIFKKIIIMINIII